MASGNQVFDFEGSKYQMLRTETITATVVRLLANAVSDSVSNLADQLSSDSRKPRRTASQRAIAFRSNLS